MPVGVLLSLRISFFTRTSQELRSLFVNIGLLNHFEYMDHLYMWFHSYKHIIFRFVFLGKIYFFKQKFLLKLPEEKMCFLIVHEHVRLTRTFWHLCQSYLVTRSDGSPRDARCLCPRSDSQVVSVLPNLVGWRMPAMSSLKKAASDSAVHPTVCAGNRPGKPVSTGLHATLVGPKGSNKPLNLKMPIIPELWKLLGAARCQLPGSRKEVTKRTHSGHNLLHVMFFSVFSHTSGMQCHKKTYSSEHTMNLYFLNSCFIVFYNLRKIWLQAF